MYLSTPEVKELALRAFPDYRGRTFKVEPFQGPMRLDSHWSGGSRDYFQFVTWTGKSAAVPENGTPFTPSMGPLAYLPTGVALVKRSIFCGTDCGITIYVHPENLNALALPPAQELSEHEKTVLKYTRTYKNTYGGQTNIRFNRARAQTGITEIEWELAKKSCIEKGLLNKAGAITNEGRNAAQ